MSEETSDDTTPTTSEDAPVEPPTEEDETKPSEDTETPPTPDLPSQPPPLEPATYYAVTSACTTQDMGDGTPCPNLNTTTTEPMVYSNAGTIIMICGLCSKKRPILEAVKLNPQPEVS